MSRFDPNSNANALLGGVNGAIAIGGLMLRQEQMRQAQAQQEIENRILMDREARAAEEAAARAAEVQRRNKEQDAAQHYLTGQFHEAAAPDFFAPAGETIPNTNDAFFDAAQRMQQSEGQFAGMNPALQSHILEPMIRRQELTQRRGNLARELQRMFPSQPMARQQALDSWDLQNLGGFDERETMHILNERPFDITEARNRLVEAGAAPDMVTSLLLARESDRQGIPASSFNALQRPYVDPIELERLKQQGRLDAIDKQYKNRASLQDDQQAHAEAMKTATARLANDPTYIGFQQKLIAARADVKRLEGDWDDYARVKDVGRRHELQKEAAAQMQAAYQNVHDLESQLNRYVETFASQQRQPQQITTTPAAGGDAIDALINSLTPEQLQQIMSER